MVYQYIIHQIYVRRKTYCTLAQQQNCSTDKTHEKTKWPGEQNFSNQKNIKDSLSTTATSINEPVLIDEGILDSQKTQRTHEDIAKDTQPDKILAQKKFDEYLIEAIDEALTSLGEPVKNTVYFQLESSFNIPKNEIPSKIDDFSDIIHKIFGLGACRLEIKFMKNLHSKINVNVEVSDYEWPLSKWIINDISFKEYVYNARKNYCETQKNCGANSQA